jgi:DNA-binding GntR family transcriptional regulator
VSSKIDNRALKEYIYEKIKSLIQDGVYTFGEKINKNELIEKFQVSPTPINDALNRLVGEQLLIQDSRRGYFVKEFNDREFCELFEFRMGIESVAAALCCEKCTDEEMNTLVTAFDSFSLPMNDEERKRYQMVDKEFHNNILKFSRNIMIMNMMETTGFLGRAYQKGLVRGPEITISEHKEVCDALRKRDPDLATTSMMQHLKGSRDLFRQRIEYEEKFNR